MAARAKRRRLRGPSKRPALFARGLRQGYLTFDEIEHALAGEGLTPSERWLVYFSLRAARIEIRTSVPPAAGNS